MNSSKDSFPLKHLVVGLGSIGRRHAGLLLSNGCHVAGADPVIKEFKDIKIYPSMEKGFEFDPGMVWLCSPTKDHAGQAVKVIEKGIHLFIEKPAAHSLEPAVSILDSHKKAPTFVWCAVNMRYHPAVVVLKNLLAQGLIGKPVVFRIHFSHWLPNMRPGTDYRQTYAAGREGGGIVLDDVHDIDLALWMAGPAVNVSGAAYKSGMLEMESEDMADISIQHKNGMFSQIHMDYLRKDKSRGIEIIGDKGSIEWRSRFKAPEVAVIRYFPSGSPQSEILWQKKIENFDGMFERQFEALKKRFRSEKLYDKSLIDAVEVLKVVSQIR